MKLTEEPVQMMKFINATKDNVLTLSAGKGMMNFSWCVDASFAVHPDCKSHSSLVMKFRNGKESPISGSKKQKLNTDGFTIAELVAVHQFPPKVPWTPLFSLAQGHDVEENLTSQDNKSAISLEENGKRSSGKRTWAVNMRCFVMTDQIEKDNVKIVCCPADDMAGDFMTKGAQGLKSGKFRKVIVGFQRKVCPHECIVSKHGKNI